MSYDTREAARLISWSNKQASIGPLSEADLTKWIDDGVGLLEWAYTYVEDGEEIKCIDFLTLISLRLICLLRSSGASIEDLNRITVRLRRELGVEWPFASKTVWNLHDKPLPASASKSEGGDFKYQLADWKGDYWNLWGNPRLPNTEALLYFGEDGVASAWLPAEDIKIDPRFVSGSPCLAGTRIPTGVIAGMVRGGDSVEELADAYDISQKRVEKALEWERKLANLAD